MKKMIMSVLGFVCVMFMAYGLSAIVMPREAQKEVTVTEDSILSLEILYADNDSVIIQTVYEGGTVRVDTFNIKNRYIKKLSWER